jgi:hypothetical protein
MRFTVTLSDKYASGEPSQDNCEAYLSFFESNDTLPRATFTVFNLIIKLTSHIQGCLHYADLKEAADASKPMV